MTIFKFQNEKTLYHIYSYCVLADICFIGDKFLIGAG